ncbi:MAG TPA: MFS transporter [Microlunatus sp.]
MSSDPAGGSPNEGANSRPSLRDLPAAFWQLLGNNLLATVTNFTVWTAVSFFTFLQTHSVFATGLIAGIYFALTASFGIWFGALVDHHRKKAMMLASSVTSLTLYGLALALFLIVDPAHFTDPADPLLWVLVMVLMLAVIAGNIRGIAMSTAVTLLVPADRRDRANGLVGSITGLSFLVTSVISGLLIGFAGMVYVIILAVACTALAIVHLALVRWREPVIERSDEHPRKVDLRGTIKIIGAVPGLTALIVFSLMNNFLHGILIALVDPYGLSLVPVQTWGLLTGAMFSFVLVGGALVARFGLGPNPLRTMLGCNIALWSTMAVFTVQSSIVLLMVGIAIYQLLFPFIEAAEQTIMQEMIPYERQGRVFGFAQSLEQAASPLSAFAISPLAQFVVIPLMSTGAGAQLIGSWYGVGPERGIALIYTIVGVLGLVLAIVATRSRPYRSLAAAITSGRAGTRNEPAVESAG